MLNIHTYLTQLTFLGSVLKVFGPIHDQSDSCHNFNSFVGFREPGTVIEFEE